jgi:hypothetical protein
MLKPATVVFIIVLLTLAGCSTSARPLSIPPAPAAPGLSAAVVGGNLLRNGGFDDDWLTLMPQNMTLHWAYPYAIYNRRDYHPDGWSCHGNWVWEKAGRMLLCAPDSQVSQRVNWDAVNDESRVVGPSDAGGFPDFRPLPAAGNRAMLRDVTATVRLDGQHVEAGAGTIELAWCPPGHADLSDPYGTETAPDAASTAPIPAGTYRDQLVRIALQADTFHGTTLPGTLRVTIRYHGAAGAVAVRDAEVAAAPSQAPNLLSNASFEETDRTGWPQGWGRPQKYSYFPPRDFYLFNTWHNSDFENRGVVQPDHLVTHSGATSLQMIVPAGDEVCVSSEPVTLHQNAPVPLEVSAWIKTDHLAMLQIDAVDQDGERLDGFDFINKAPLSIGTQDWRLVRQVFSPKRAVRSVRLQLCARGVNGCTLGDTTDQPQNNAAGMIWWDDLRLSEPSSTAEQLKARGVRPSAEHAPATGAVRLEGLDTGEQLQGENRLRATIRGADHCHLRFDYVLPAGRKLTVEGQSPLRYALPEACPPYHEVRGRLAVVDQHGNERGSTELWLAPWSSPLMVELGALYPLPEQKQQSVRLNLGLSSESMAAVSKVRLELVRRGTEAVLRSVEVPATASALEAQRGRLPAGVHGDLRNLLWAEIEIGDLPVQPFNDPQRNWLIRAQALDAQSNVLFSIDSQPFCRLGHDRRQAFPKTIGVRHGMVEVNGQAWMPWSAIYGHIARYADEHKILDLKDLPRYDVYAGFNDRDYNRHDYDFNCNRYVAGSITSLDEVARHWNDDNLLCSTAFVAKSAIFSARDLPGADYLSRCAREAVVSVSPGIEEEFGLMSSLSATQIQGLKNVTDDLRRLTGKPAMVGHGGYWNRFEFEKVPFFDIYDPETEPLFPAPLRSHLTPLLAGHDAAVWLRPQMYEDVPYERWRFHTYVEMMEGARGWQMAHGPGDASLFRGLHGEVEFWRPILASGKAIDVDCTPSLEHWAANYQGKTWLMAATSHPLWFGYAQWDASDGPAGAAGSWLLHKPEGNFAPVTTPRTWLGRTYGYHGMQNLPQPRHWPAGSVLHQWIKLDPRDMPGGLAVVLKVNGRWNTAHAFGTIDLSRLRTVFGLDSFLRAFYPNAIGFLGWGPAVDLQFASCAPGVDEEAGALPAGGKWVRLDVPLPPGSPQLDGVAVMLDRGTVRLGPAAVGDEPLWQNAAGRVSFHVPGLRAGQRVKVLFEDRDVISEDGQFSDDFSGADLYQRFGGQGFGYGNWPVALHCYVVDRPRL